MSRPGGATPLYTLYSGLTRLAAPLVLHHVGRKLSDQGVEARRIRERAGRPSLDRPPGELIWFHGASVGESLSVLSVIDRLARRRPDAHFLVTSGTASSAQILARRLPPRALHQFAPLDAPHYIDRFLDHWQPRAGIFVESELWPGMLVRARDRGLRLALLNARLSEKSARGWARHPDTARMVLDCFDILLTQNATIAERLRLMGADAERLSVGANLKAAAAPLPVDEITRDELRRALGDRPVWAASSTHPGEDEIVLDAHARVLERHPDALLLLIPRHPERGDDLQRMIAERGLARTRRSAGERITAATQVYLADTLGETGTWYAACPLILLGGSLLPDIGGHNPFEPAVSGAAVLTGPHVANFSETFGPMIDRGAATEVATPAEIAGKVGDWLASPALLADKRAAARAFARTEASALDQVIDRMIDCLAL
ncbi:3-deoxy-D-manno-octulosonic acid transferase [Marinibacterium sp. SX1]|uniref:3-deoxy-D-manno-octulosonic acid transferase n=1 Tax=Marinibacterium sp. SX1 TaxID=3388424 RepID=UPI003D185F7D